MLDWKVLLLDDTQVSQCEPSVSRCDVKRELKEFSEPSACKGLGWVRTPWSSSRLQSAMGWGRYDVKSAASVLVKVTFIG